MLQPNLTEKHILAILKSPALKRCDHAIKQIVDWEIVWGLYNNRWASVKDEQDINYFSLWPAKEYASLCNQNFGNDYKPKSVSLQNFLQNCIPKLLEQNYMLMIFMTPLERGITIDIETFIKYIDVELEKY